MGVSTPWRDLSWLFLVVPVPHEKMSTAELNPRAVRVSPLIKFGRWSFLIAGIAYGVVNQNRLSKKETAWREVESKRKIIRDKQLAEEKKIASELEMKNLETMMK